VRRALITGGAGFIGSTLADRLLAQGVEIAILDDFRTGRREFIEDALATGGAELFDGDILDRDLLDRATAGCDAVFHLQANADVRHGLSYPQRDLEQNTAATSHVLEAMRAHGVRTIAFASTGSVYGEPEVFPTPEDAPFPIQTSLYGASKLAGEGMIGAYCHGLGYTGLVYRFVSVLGERYTHGHVIDFYRALTRDPTRLRILGDGRQEKSYLYVRDCVTAMLTAFDHHAGQEGLFVYNLGTDETVTVDGSIHTITEHMGVSPRIERSGGRRGWPGDSPLIHLETSKLRGLGWAPELSIREAITRTLDWFEREPGIVGIDQEAPAP
jgi:UDP-glucose 4-epimerase